jgi:hypothetical protein
MEWGKTFFVDFFSPLRPFCLLNPLIPQVLMSGFKMYSKSINLIYHFVAYDALLKSYNQDNGIAKNTF